MFKSVQSATADAIQSDLRSVGRSANGKKRVFFDVLALKPRFSNDANPVLRQITFFGAFRHGEEHEISLGNGVI